MTQTPFLVTILLAVPAFAQTTPEKMSFFITSDGPGDGAALGGLSGASRRRLAELQAEIDLGAPAPPRRNTGRVKAHGGLAPGAVITRS